MCSGCITSAAIMTASVNSAGGLRASLASRFRKNVWWATALNEPEESEREESSAEPESASFEEWIAAVLAGSQETQCR